MKSSKQWDIDSVKLLDTNELIKEHVYGLDILRNTGLTLKDIKEYTKTLQVKHFYSTAHSTYPYPSHCYYWSGTYLQEETCDYDVYGRPIPGTERLIPVHIYMVREDMFLAALDKVGKMFKHILLTLLSQAKEYDYKLAEFINKIRLGGLYLEKDNYITCPIASDTYKEHFMEYEELLSHTTDKDLTYNHMAEVGTGRQCNNMEYYVNLKKLVKYVKNKIK